MSLASGDLAVTEYITGTRTFSGTPFFRDKLMDPLIQGVFSFFSFCFSEYLVQIQLLPFLENAFAFL